MSLGVAPTSTPIDGGVRNPLHWKAAKFGVVGVAATAVHLTIAWILLDPIGGLAANAAGFGVGLVVTYLGNYFATFKSQAAHAPTLIRFLVVSAATLAVSEWAFVALHAMRIDERVGLVVAIALLPLLRFGLLAHQVFVPSEAQASLLDWLITVAVWSGSVGFGLLALWVVAPAGFLDPGGAVWATGAANEIPLFELAVGAGRPLLGDEFNYLPGWFLLAFSAVGPAAVALLRSLSVRRPDLLLFGAAVAATVPSLTFSTLSPALSGQFLILLIPAAALRIGRTEQRIRATVVLGFALLVTTLVHPVLLLASLPLVGGGWAHRLRRETIGRTPSDASRKRKRLMQAEGDRIRPAHDELELPIAQRLRDFRHPR